MGKERGRGKKRGREKKERRNGRGGEVKGRERRDGTPQIFYLDRRIWTVETS